jgi:hypothetical protein
MFGQTDFRPEGVIPTILVEQAVADVITEQQT